MKKDCLCNRCMFQSDKKEKKSIKISQGYCLSPNATIKEINTKNCEHFLPNNLG